MALPALVAAAAPSVIKAVTGGSKDNTPKAPAANFAPPPALAAPGAVAPGTPTPNVPMNLFQNAMPAAPAGQPAPNGLFDFANWLHKSATQ